jgi:prepilin-type N-terminal cleavage/methylation domain-containing protein
MRRQGFTVAELIVVLAIIAIIYFIISGARRPAPANLANDEKMVIP